MNDDRATAGSDAGLGGDAEGAPEEALVRCRSMLLQAAKLAEMGQQVAGLVHEMNQPLMGIKAFAQMIKKEAVDPRLARRAAFIEEQAVVLERLAGRVRKHSRHGEVDLEARIRPADAVRRAVELLSHRLKKTGAHVRVALPEDLPDVRMGPLHAQQLLVNLVGNAADAVDGRPERRIEITADLEGEAVVLVVADTGGGIPAAGRERIFEPFFTTKDDEHGTGLGLPISREIVQAYGGHLTVAEDPESRAGPGMRTAMVVRLPAAR